MTVAPAMLLARGRYLIVPSPLSIITFHHSMAHKRERKSHKKRSNKRKKPVKKCEVILQEVPQQELILYQPNSVLKVALYPDTPPIIDASDPDDSETETYVSANEEPQEPQSESQPTPIPLSLTILRTLSRTLSCVSVVSISEDLVLPGLPTVAAGSKLILKLCDRRASDGLREEHKAARWTPEIEEDFRRFQAMPEAEQPEVSIEPHNNSWHYKGDEDDVEPAVAKDCGGVNVTGNAEVYKRRISPDKWTPGHREAYLEKKTERLFQTEVNIYRQLREVQGKKVPLVYGIVRFPQTGMGPDVDGAEVRGLLMEYISPSFTLREIPEIIPDRALWQDAGKTAVKLVQDIGDLGVINQDVRLDNVLLVHIKDGFQDDDVEEEMVFEEARTLKFFKAVMIDFGLSRLQMEDETDDDFRRARHQQDEEGAVGFVLEKHLMKAVSGKDPKEKKDEDRPFKFQHSSRLVRSWDNDEADI